MPDLPSLPRLHTAEEIASALRVSESWVKERARRREIPFTLVGGSYRFTEAHLEEIVQIFEQRPESIHGQVVTAPRRRTKQPAPEQTAVVPLQARQPQRRPKAG
jgi:excisionase family DNA binding protein